MDTTYGALNNATLAVDTWESLTNVYDVNKFWGCGYEGTGNGITNHTFGNGTNCGEAWTSATSLSAASVMLAAVTTCLF